MFSPQKFPEDAEAAFEFRLARDLGMTVAELRHRITPGEFGEWVAFYAAEAGERARATERAARAAKRGR